MKDEYKKKYTITDLDLLEKYYQQGHISFPLKNEIKENLVTCAMLAIKEGKFKSLNYLIEKQESILSEKDSGIFRMTTEISSLEVFKNTIDYLFFKDKNNDININANDNGFLKELIKKDKIEYIQYVIEHHKKFFTLDDEILFKTLIRNKNKDMFNYFVFKLNMPIKDTDNLKVWLVENGYESELIKIQKRNLFNQLSNDLKEKNFNLKSNKI